ncbi:Hypothetical_protein [Hexamita inflata]|uniref:Hypothetical_protein n=1 Tax=Hexamita inflata TaxID=28002 RepID=A0AA86NRZ4_9EUKA|nr:Hypothetical protein HINF_LOCUS11873 [Hexamita inflata]
MEYEEIQKMKLFFFNISKGTQYVTSIKFHSQIPKKVKNITIPRRTKELSIFKNKLLQTISTAATLVFQVNQRAKVPIRAKSQEILESQNQQNSKQTDQQKNKQVKAKRRRTRSDRIRWIFPSTTGYEAASPTRSMLPAKACA